MLLPEGSVLELIVGLRSQPVVASSRSILANVQRCRIVPVLCLDSCRCSCRTSVTRCLEAASGFVWRAETARGRGVGAGVYQRYNTSRYESSTTGIYPDHGCGRCRRQPASLRV